MLDRFICAAQSWLFFPPAIAVYSKWTIIMMLCQGVVTAFVDDIVDEVPKQIQKTWRLKQILLFVIGVVLCQQLWLSPYTFQTVLWRLSSFHYIISCIVAQKVDNYTWKSIALVWMVVILLFEYQDNWNAIVNNYTIRISLNIICEQLSEIQYVGRWIWNIVFIYDGIFVWFEIPGFEYYCINRMHAVGYDTAKYLFRLVWTHIRQ